jgi:hypothetical protein
VDGRGTALSRVENALMMRRNMGLTWEGQLLKGLFVAMHKKF